MEKNSPKKLGATRLSAQRRVILEDVLGCKSHPTADMVYRSVQHKLPRISLGTVYRNLESLSEGGYIQRIDTGTGPRRYDGDTRTHAHIRCIACDKLEDIAVEEHLESLIPENTGTGYTINDVIIEIRGLCPECQKKAAV
ncbi:transcriptional repressor [Desulfobotulus sp. H1]|uniref:Transcriptional repressor n=1 Tax=Desulfobotulus pelophilus TaxID=2823377 RepID=A0ABT3NB40_9BACT|nr:transcriptional repressor [Desulfobotulus pelophilus]MCW7754671.1 transcriptional repressor [Desulfobotulus pelophilus]